MVTANLVTFPLCFGDHEKKEEANRREEGRSVNGPEYGSHGIVSLWSPFAHICRTTAVFV